MGDGAPEFHNGLDEACAAYRHVLPKPKVYGYCRKGFEHHFEMVCRNMCGNQVHHMSMGEAAGGQFCKQYKRTMPKPGAHEACKHGHARGLVASLTLGPSPSSRSTTRSR